MTQTQIICKGCWTNNRLKYYKVEARFGDPMIYEAKSKMYIQINPVLNMLTFCFSSSKKFLQLLVLKFFSIFTFDPSFKVNSYVDLYF